ncbi:MAG: exodeoxyribonuclease VII large subunit [Ignavibacterium sp.]
MIISNDNLFVEEKQILTVSALTKLIKQTLEEKFDNINLVGEISNFKAYISGHWYFTLKDNEAQISCTMWRSLNNYVFFTPQDGMKIIITGRITVYPPRGNYQIDVRSMKPAGEGELQLAFEKLKEKLFNEGLFDEKHKKPIPQFPEKIGIATSIDGAALRDMISVAKRRFPLVELIIAPCQVQGADGVNSIINSIKKLNERNDIDVIIVARGGGSIEDLWNFNEEAVARAIYESKIPIITGIGHEIDFTIADFVSDLRAPTPTAAMELATPKIEDIDFLINDFLSNSSQIIFQLIKENKNKLLQLNKSYGFRVPFDLIKSHSQKLDFLISKINDNINKKLNNNLNKIYLLQSNVESHNINKSLKKGFVLVNQEGKFVIRAKNFLRDKSFKLKFFDNEIEIKK